MIHFLAFVTEFRKTATSHYLFSLLFLVLIVNFVSCSGSQQVSDKTATASVEQDEATGNDKLEELYWTRVDSAKMQFTQADVDFMKGMITHHAQALIMSDLAPKNNAGPSVQTLASRIINAQKDEIQSMQQWLRDRGQPVPEVHIDGLQLMIKMDSSEDMEGHSHMNQSHSNMDHSNMPGMLTQEELNELAGLTGDDFDRAFLAYMIEHHKGGVYMSEQLFSKDGAALDDQAFRLASDIQVDQTTEIERMQLMLQNMTDS